MAVSGIQGKLLEVTVVGCSRLKDTEWISRQDPYVCLQYVSARYRTRTHTDGGTSPAFQEKFVLTLVEGRHEIDILVFNENTLTYDDFIGSGKVQLHKVLTTGFDDSSWTIQTKTGRYAGEVRLIMHYSYASRTVTSHGPSAVSYGAAPVSHSPNPLYPYIPPLQSAHAPPPPQAIPTPSPYHPQPPPVYPQAAYPPPPPPIPSPSHGVYHSPTPSTYPPSPYQSSPHGVAPHYHPSGPHGMYPPPY